MAIVPEVECRCYAVGEDESLDQFTLSHLQETISMEKIHVYAMTVEYDEGNVFKI